MLQIQKLLLKSFFNIKAMLCIFADDNLHHIKHKQYKFKDS